MPEEPAQLRVDCHNTLGEMPVWSAGSETLYWVDVVKPGRVFRWRPADERLAFWEFDDLVTGVDLICGGGLLVRGRRTVSRFDPDTGGAVRVFSLPESPANMRFNDGHCDRAGRLWVGTMENNITDAGEPVAISQAAGQILAITGTSATAVDARLGCPNAICWSPDGGTFYIADSCDGWLYAYRFDGGPGTISGRRALCHLEGLGIPDGAAVDRAGYIWNARWGAGAVARISPDGRLDRVVRVPASQPTACCFGDRDLRTLYITTARFALPVDTLKSEAHAGGVFAVRVDVPGLEQPAFGGAHDR